MTSLGQDLGMPGDDPALVANATANRFAAQIFEKLERFEVQELLAQSSYHWLLSAEEHKLTISQPSGLTMNMLPFSHNNIVFLIPQDPSVDTLDCREIHQIIRELVLGIFGMNQLPELSLEANFDESTSCQLPPAYIDTHLGQIMINIDYMMKCLWHGSYFPRDKRLKFVERWRSSLDVNVNGVPETKKTILNEFTMAGMLDITKDPDFNGIYENMRLFPMSEHDANQDKRLFMQYVSNMSMQLTFRQISIMQHENLFVLDSDFNVSSLVRMVEDKVDRDTYERLKTRLQAHVDVVQRNLTNKKEIRRQVELVKFASFLIPVMLALRRRNKVPDISRLLPPLTDFNVASLVRMVEDKVDRDTYERLKTRLQAHVDVVQRNLTNKKEIRRQVELVKFASFLIPVMLALRRRNKVLDISRLLPPLTADECKTERELPPLMLSSDFRCPNFDFSKKYFNLHGGVTFDIETDEIQAPHEAVVEDYDNLQLNAATYLARITDPDAPFHESFPIPTTEVNGKKYYVLAMSLETFYPVSPPQPLWVHACYEKIKDLKPKRLPLSDVQMFEMFKKRYGTKQAIKLKNLQSGLKMSGIRGYVCMFKTLAHKCTAARLAKQDEEGYSLMHHAAMFNKPLILQLLKIQKQDLNCRRNSLTSKQGITPLHLAAKSGSLDAALCLVGNKVDICMADIQGWAAIHHAAFYDHAAIVRLIIRKFPDQMELETFDKLRRTPLLLAASSGALDVVKIIVDLRGEIKKVDMEKNNMIHLAALRFHTNVLEYFIEWNNPDVRVWETLVGMLNSETFQKKDSAVRSLEVLTTSNKSYWKAILDANGIPALVQIMMLPQTEMQSLAAAVLCNLSNQKTICLAIAKANAIPVLIKLLGSGADDIQSRAAIIVADMAVVEDNQSLISDAGGIEPLIHLLDSELEDVLVEAVNAIRVLCANHKTNQTLVAKYGGAEPLVEFLQVDSNLLQAASAAAIAALMNDHTDNQIKIVQLGAVEPLVRLLRLRNVAVQVKAAAALESMALNNQESQAAILALNAPTPLIRLLTNWKLDVKEQAACTLWALAGHTRPQQKKIAEFMGIAGIIDLIVKSERLQYVGCMALIALTRDSFEKQNKLKEENGILPLVRILRSTKTSERVLLTVIRALGTLCIGVAYVNNKKTQDKIAEEGTISTLVQLLKSSTNELIKVEVAITIGCMIICNRDNQEILKDEPLFSVSLLLTLLHSKDEGVRLKAGTALATFAFNNTAQQIAIRESGGIRMSAFKQFLDTNNEEYQAFASFQIVVLARVIVDRDQVSLTAEGVTNLVRLLRSGEDNTVILSGSLTASLAHTRAGIPEAMVTTGAVDILIGHLFSNCPEVRCAAAVALGYLTFNRRAARLLLVASRNTPGLYDRLTDNLDKDGRICGDFTDEFRRATIVGLPALSLEIHGGPPAVPPPRPRGTSARPRTSMSYHRPQEQHALPTRAISAPARTRQDRAKSAPARRERLTPVIKLNGGAYEKRGKKVAVMDEKGDANKKKQTAAWM